MSGAAEYLDRMDRDVDDYDGFAQVTADEFAGRLAARLYDLSVDRSSVLTAHGTLPSIH